MPEVLSDLIKHCISFHPGDRPRSFSEVARVLRSVFARIDASQIRARELTVSKTYDIALSFAGTERALAEQIYWKLQCHCRVFYDNDAQTRADLWGSNLSTRLHEVYANQAAYCLVLISNEYVERAWTNWERRAILQRMVNSKTGEYILPVLIDDVVLPGLPATVGTLTIREAGIDGIVDAVLRKVQGSAGPR